MAEWEDEDFGGFESADIGTQSFEQTISGPKVGDLNKEKDSQSGILSWIIANSPKSNAPVEPPENQVANSSSDKGQDKEYLRTLSEIERDASPFQTDGWSLTRGNVQQEGTEANATSANSTVTTIANPPNASDDLFASFNAESNPTVFFEEGDSTQGNLKSTPFQVSPEYLESQNAIKGLSAEEPKIERQNDDAILELTAKLDAMTVLKEQTEKSLGNLQEELRNITKQTKEDLEKKNEKHNEELERIHAQHQEEMKQLHTTSEETIKVISQQYNTMWNEFIKQEDLEKESNASTIVEKCVAALEQQREMLSGKLQEDRAANENKIKDIFQKERDEMDGELRERMIEEKRKLEREMKESLKEEMKAEAKRMEEIHLSTLKEAMTNQQENFEKQMQETLKKEREKFSEVLKNAVEETQKSTEKSMEARRKVDEARKKNQTMAVKMLLTSALGHLEQKDDLEVKEETDQDSSCS